MTVLTEQIGTEFGPRDVGLMRRALEHAANGLGLARPNPMVGALVVADGEIAGVGWHEGPGTAHAEINALAEAGERARGATLYVTLEPCSHFGRTPPCAPAVAEAGVRRVVAAMRDPNPAVDGNGFDILRACGVEVVEGVLAGEAAALNPGFIKCWNDTLPFVTLKMAASLDGKVAARDGSSRWVTGEEARRDVHMLRAAAGAIVVGAGTALADDPSLTVRLDRYRGHQPLRVVVDSTGRVPAAGALFDGQAPTLVATTDQAPQESWQAWVDAGAEVVICPQGPGDEPTVDLKAVLEHLLESRRVLDVLIEGGPTLAWSASAAGVVDRFVLYLAPKLIGGRDAPGLLGGFGVETIGEAVPAEIVSVERLGADVKVVAELQKASSNPASVRPSGGR